MKTLIATLALTAAAIAGCGPAGTPAGSSSGSPRGGMDRDKAVKFVNCMNKQGIPAKLAEDGEGISIEGDREPDKTKLSAAEKACAEFMPFAPGPQVGTAEWDRLVKYAQCLRRNGANVEMPKPGDAGLRISDRDQKLDQAQKACAEYAPSGP